MFLYDTDVPISKVKDPTAGGYPPPLDIMRQDLIAAGWQAAMSKNWAADPRRTLARMKRRWASDAEVIEIVRQQDNEFSYAK